jgi:diguanylate cyclase (GGDEF)-like protein/PAS domain S-box-containing protein
MSALSEADEFGQSHGMQFELPLAREEHWFELSVSCKTANPGATPRFIVLSRRITERKRVEEALRTSEQRFRDMVNTSDGIVWEADATTFTFTFIGKNAERLLGYPIEDWLKPGFWIEHLHPEDQEWAPAYCAACTGRLEPHDFEYRAIASDGRTVWLRDIVTVVAENGTPRWLRGIMVDITNSKQAAIALQENAERYNAITQSAIDAIVTADSAGNIVGWNPSAERIFGYTEAEVSLQPLTLLMPERYRERHLAGMNRLLSGTQFGMQGKSIEVEGLRKDGNEFPMELSLAKWAVSGNSFFSGTIRDITNRKRAEASLRIAAIAFESQEGMIVTDADAKILRVNRAFTEISGYPAEEATGQTPNLLNSGRHEAGFFTAMWDEIRRNGTWQGEIWNRRKNGDVYLQWLTISVVKSNARDVTNYVGTMTDITRHKQAEDAIQHLAFYDALTQLPNRRLLLDRLQQAIAACSRSGHEGALLFIDLDDFKTLNETLGHDIGDLLLRQVAQRLPACVREGDTVARFGGDEFVVMLEDLSDDPQEAAIQAEAVGEKILASLNHRYKLAGAEHHSTPSIGVALFGSTRDTVEELLKRADLAMYQAKAAGRNTLRFFDPQMQTAVSARATLETDLRMGLRNSEFLLYYQPQVDNEGRLRGVEALVRWLQPQRGLVAPAEFIPLAESLGLILPLGHWVLETACEQLVSWASQPGMTDVTMAVNVSARQFRHKDFVDQVLAVLDHTGANPNRLKLELTESPLVDDVEDTINKMTVLKNKGVSFSLDDFGTGYSSLSYLKRLPLDQLKIDQSFVRDILTDSNDASIARTVIALGQSLGLAVIAEGVETEEQRNFLAENGCLNFQGYLFGRPGPAAECEQFRNPPISQDL